MTIGWCAQLSVPYPLMLGGEAGSGSGNVSALQLSGGRADDAKRGRAPANGNPPTTQAGSVHATAARASTSSDQVQLRSRTPFLLTSFPALPALRLQEHNVKETTKAVCLLYPPRQQPRNSTSTSVFHFSLLSFTTSSSTTTYFLLLLSQPSPIPATQPIDRHNRQLHFGKYS